MYSLGQLAERMGSIPTAPACLFVHPPHTEYFERKIKENVSHLKKVPNKVLSYSIERRNTGQPLWKGIWQYVAKPKTHILFDLAIPLFGICPQIYFHMCAKV